MNSLQVGPTVYPVSYYTEHRGLLHFIIIRGLIFRMNRDNALLRLLALQGAIIQAPKSRDQMVTLHDLWRWSPSRFRYHSCLYALESLK